MRALLSIAVVCALAACASAPQAPGPAGGATRFRDPDRIVIAGPDDSLPRPASPRRAMPEYPAALRSAGVGGQLVVAFVIDSMGRVEPRSVTFVESAPRREFHTAVCEYLRETRFVPARRDGIPRRTMVFMPFQFWTGSGPTPPPPPPRPDMRRYHTMARETPPAELFATLERRPRC